MLKIKKKSKYIKQFKRLLRNLKKINVLKLIRFQLIRKK